MTTVTMVDGTMVDGTVVDLVTGGIADELSDRLAGVVVRVGDQSGPGPPPAVQIAGCRVEVGAEPVLVGRGAAFGIDHPKVSRRHVGVQRVDGVLIATDVGSRNGTWLVREGERSPLTPMAVLRPGDRLITLDDVELLCIDTTCIEIAGSP
jgi:hypothetical protein